MRLHHDATAGVLVEECVARVGDDRYEAAAHRFERRHRASTLDRGRQEEQAAARVEGLEVVDAPQHVDLIARRAAGHAGVHLLEQWSDAAQKQTGIGHGTHDVFPRRDRFERRLRPLQAGDPKGGVFGRRLGHDLVVERDGVANESDGCGGRQLAQERHVTGAIGDDAVDVAQRELFDRSGEEAMRPLTSRSEG